MNKYFLMIIGAAITAAGIGIIDFMSTGKLLQSLWVTMGVFVVYILSDSVQKFLRKKKTDSSSDA
ncbi:hypothetical protein LPAF129_17150 [Ligilactobacillus pabuli]|uniref:Uncharacterized protein n=1 Tax=Ligilactobacillus pabuli TaxID=2886039 RepID=A0ABQ5JIS4_9LACO|nr:hypothetical protein [Ligilactobacillus pabuli]GKS82029.1 hypothetical protein LPAF129_17150 [Ligilactobacillus pabuli]